MKEIKFLWLWFVLWFIIGSFFIQHLYYLEIWEKEYCNKYKNSRYCLNNSLTK